MKRRREAARRREIDTEKQQVARLSECARAKLYTTDENKLMIYRGEGGQLYMEPASKKGLSSQFLRRHIEEGVRKEYAFRRSCDSFSFGELLSFGDTFSRLGTYRVDFFF